MQDIKNKLKEKIKVPAGDNYIMIFKTNSENTILEEIHFQFVIGWMKIKEKESDIFKIKLLSRKIKSLEAIYRIIEKFNKISFKNGSTIKQDYVIHLLRNREDTDLIIYDFITGQVIIKENVICLR